MALPSLSDVFFVIVLIVPGFVSLTLLRWIALFESELSDLRLTIWSLVMSLVVYGFFGLYTGLSDFDAIRDQVLLPRNLFFLFSGSILLGIIPGLLIRLGFRRGRYVRGDSWSASMQQASIKGSWVIVYTTKGQEYMGILHYSGGKNFPKEVSIREPTQIFRDSKGFLEEEVKIGKEILFSEEDIARIAFFKEV